MSDKCTYSESVDNYRGGKPLTLETGSTDGRVYIRLVDDHEQHQMECLLELEEAKKVAAAINTAIREAK